MTIVTGTRLGRYEIRSKIGAGGMGEVYRAQDTTLDRKVALKILPADMATDRDRMRRFTQEARAAATLNHPNIAHIYEIGESDGVNFIAMEFVNGDSLRQLLQRGRPTVQQAIEFVAQAASAIVVAHKAGIVHRDLKPENLMVIETSQIKVLDFGLAKLVDKQQMEGLSKLSTLVQSGADAKAETSPGVIMGTVGYMSPEQAAGRNVDHRSDIFSLGVVLYEMLTGKRPFDRKSAIDTLHAVINEDPPSVVELNDRLPIEISDLLDKALAKDPGERYQHIGDFELDLRRFKQALATNSLFSVRTRALPPRPTSDKHRNVPWAIVAGLLILCIILGAWIFWSARRSTTVNTSTAHTIATQLTNYGGGEGSGALSPNGKSFVFVSEHGGTPDLWVRQITGGEPVRLTNDPAQEANPVYSPDGETIYFTRLDSAGASVWRIGPLGGQAQRIVSNARRPAPSADGRSLAYFIRDPNGQGVALAVSGVDGGGARTIGPRFLSGDQPTGASWSPDGLQLSYVRGGLFAPSNLFVVEISTGKERQVTQFTRSSEGVQSQTWLPDNRHLVVCYVHQQTSFQNDLGVLDIQDGSILRLTFNIEQSFDSLSLSADGTRLIATASQTRREVWKVPLGPDPDANGRAAVRLVDSSLDPMWTYVSRDGKTLLFNSSTTGSRNLWTMALDRAAPPRQITAIPGYSVLHSSLSLDGTRVTFASRATGNSDIWVQNVDGSELRQLTNDEAADAWPVWSPDGQWIVFASLRGDRWETRRIAAGGGASEKITDGFFRGDLIHQPGGTGTWLVSSIAGDSGIRLLDFERADVLWEDHFAGGGLSLPMFSPDGHFISVPRQETRDREAIWLYESATGKSHVAVRFAEPFRMYFRACWVDDSKALIVNRYQVISHIVLFDRFWTKDGTP